jgi:hypothetical protein
MVNELEEYLKILVALLEGKPVPRYSALHHVTAYPISGNRQVPYGC